jgi:biotin-dependent carboxylase-like uncharacterized protein
VITVLDPGRFTSFQDGGRVGFAHLGVPRAGAADSLSLRQANLLVGNPENAVALEMTLSGPVLHFEVDAVIALTGGQLDARLDDEPLAMYQSIAVRAGQILNCGRLHTGMRAYLAVAGGFAAQPVLGSASTDTLAHLGPPVLRGGEAFGVQACRLERGWYWRTPPAFGGSATLRVVAGPHAEWFTPGALAEFLHGEFEVCSNSDRSGLRLAGVRVPRGYQNELRSQGMVSGAVQVPGDGHPIALLCNHGATGGYPVIAVVIAADLPRLGQLQPGAGLRFRLVSREQALEALHAANAEFYRGLISADAGLLAARRLIALAQSHPELRAASLRLDGRRVRLRR